MKQEEIANQPEKKVEEKQNSPSRLKPVVSPASAAVEKKFPVAQAFLINFFRRFGTLLFISVKEFLQDECLNLAAQISYYALFSIFPLILVTVIVVSLILPKDELAIERLISQLTSNFPNNTINFGEFVTGALKQISKGQPLFIIISFIGLVWGGTGIFDSVTNSLNKAWQTQGSKPRNILESLFLRLVLLLIFIAMLISSILVTILYEAVHSFATTNDGLKILLKDNPVWDLLSFLIPWTLTFTTFLLVYRVTPQRKVTWADVWPGAVFASIFFEVVKIGFTFYISRFTNFNLAYGSITGIIVFIFWLYVIAVVLLLGGEISSVWAEMRGHKHPSKLERQGKGEEAPSNSPVYGEPPLAKP